MASVCSISIIGLFLCTEKQKHTWIHLLRKMFPYMIIWPYLMPKTQACRVNSANIWKQLTETLFTLGYTWIKTSLKEMTKAA